MSSANPSTNATDSPSDSGRASTGSNTTAYPPQRHAGKVGYGPAYHTGPSLGDKIKGYEEELKGHLTHNHALTEHGRELVSGEMKRKEHEQEMNDSGPFAHPEQNEKKSGAKE
ncbi:hypothetical protein C0991_008000 [Blastosporella zonata]|nr:hypothetical protein C0991_008000 [Blastosporella zonata]